VRNVNMLCERFCGYCVRISRRGCDRFHIRVWGFGEERYNGIFCASGPVTIEEAYEEALVGSGLK